MARKTPADIDLNATPIRVGRFWVFPSGYRAPVVSGGNGEERPTFPADLSTLSVEELQALIDASVAWSTANAEAAGTDENLANMRAVVAGYQAVTAEMALRSTEPVAPTLSELAASIVAVPPPAVAAVVAATETPVVVAPTPATGGFSQADLIAAVTAGVQAALPSPVLLSEATPVLASGDLPMPDISRLQPGVITLVDRTPTPIRGNEVITASADIPGVAQGSTLADFMDIGRAIIARRENIGDVPSDAASEKITVARVFSNLPEERTLHVGEDSRSVARKMDALLSHEALTASGGLCVPAQPYYGIMVLAGAARPVRDMLPVLTMERGGVTVLAPPVFTAAGAQTRTVTDGATTNASTTVTSATAAFDARDVGATIAGTGIPASAFITTITSATSVVISIAATATATGLTLTIVRRGAVGTVTAAQDLAALNGTLAQQIAGRKPCLHVACAGPTTVEPTAVSWCLEFGNFTTRAWPEQIPAWLKMTMAVWARTAETLLLDRMSALSTQVTLAPVLGLARDIIPGIIRMGAYLRSRHRIDDSVTLRAALPRWVLDAAACDLIKGSGYDTQYFTMARAIFAAGLAEANIVPGYYIDSGTGKGQLFNSGAAQGAGAALTFPGTVVWYLFPEGSFAFGDGGYLDFGLWRDSSLNEANNYRLMAESFEALIGLGPEMIEVTQTMAVNGTFAGAGYGSNTVSSPVAIPATTSY